MQLFPFPDEKTTLDAYKSSLYTAGAHGITNPEEIEYSSFPYYNSITNILIESNVHGTVIDYGSGWGGLTRLLLSKGFEARGVEIAESMVDYCNRKKTPVMPGNLSNIGLEDSSISAIVLSGVFEHILDPVDFFSQMHRLLKPDGLFVSLQPTAGFARLFGNFFRFGRTDLELPSALYIFDPPFHVALYSPEGMIYFAEKHGFKLLEMRPSPQGNLPGFIGLIQTAGNFVNKIGWKICGKRWPLVVAHTFVFKKSN